MLHAQPIALHPLPRSFTINTRLLKVWWPPFMQRLPPRRLSMALPTRIGVAVVVPLLTSFLHLRALLRLLARSSRASTASLRMSFKALSWVWAIWYNVPKVAFLSASLHQMFPLLILLFALEGTRLTKISRRPSKKLLRVLWRCVD